MLLLVYTYITIIAYIKAHTYIIQIYAHIITVLYNRIYSYCWYTNVAYIICGVPTNNLQYIQYIKPYIYILPTAITPSITYSYAYTCISG